MLDVGKINLKLFHLLNNLPSCTSLIRLVRRMENEQFLPDYRRGLPPGGYTIVQPSFLPA